jgi:type IV pilus assembly protein PilN
MIRINLLATGHERGRKRSVTFFETASQKLTVGSTLILLTTVGVCAWRYSKMTRESAALEAQISSAQQEASRLQSIIVEVQQFERRTAQLQQRVVLIEQLGKGQTGPVHMLDQISRALPAMLWLTELKQVGPDAIIDGKSTTQTGVSDFAANLEASGYFKRPVEIVSTQAESIPQPPRQVIRFTIKAQFVWPTAGPAKTGAPGGGGAASQ